MIDDYGHHPVEIKAALNAGRMKANGGKLIAVVQPHRYTRLRDLFDDFCSCFGDADTVIVADVYAAGEQPLDGFGKDLVGGLQAHGHRNVFTFQPDALASSRRQPQMVISSCALALVASRIGLALCQMTQCASIKKGGIDGTARN